MLNQIPVLKAEDLSKRYEDGSMRRQMGGDTRPGGKIDYPKFRYQFPAFEETLKDTAPDIILLILFNLILFAAAYYSFIRYDVR